MIGVDKREGQIVPFQIMTSPSVYLDHFAIRKISGNPALAKRFRDIVLERNGTLVISEKTVCEFAGVTDQRQAMAAEGLVVSFWPHVFFMESNIGQTIARENKQHPTARDAANCNSEHMLRAINARINVTEARIDLSKGDLFQAPEQLRVEERQNRAESVKIAKAFMHDFANAKKSEKYRGLKRTALKSIETNLGTKVVCTEIVAMYLLEMFHAARPKPKPNDYGDMIHAGVPSSYCDFVVIDKGWRHIVEQVGERIKRENLQVRIARALSEIPRNFEAAFEALEAFPASSPLNAKSVNSTMPP